MSNPESLESALEKIAYGKRRFENREVFSVDLLPRECAALFDHLGKMVELIVDEDQSGQSHVRAGEEEPQREEEQTG